MENVKRYKLGQIEIKPNDRGSLHEPPFVNYTYEQTLFSIKSVYREVDVSLVFNYGNYREETEKGATAFFISAGYKLNLQKRLIYDRNDALTHFQGEDGELVTLERFGNVFTFNDESQRILRRTEQIKKPVIGGDLEYGASTSYDHVIEYSDFGKEEYNASGRITAVKDKYGETILSYEYNGAGQPISVTIDGAKTITISYDENKLKTIVYAGKKCEIFYKENGTLDYIEDYSGVKYTLSVTGIDFEAKASAVENGVLIEYSKELKLADDEKTIVVSEKIGDDTVDTVSYKFPRNLRYYTPPFAYIDVTDKNGVETRTQYEGGKAICSYEVKNGEPQFLGEAPQSRYAGSVTLYNAGECSDNGKAAGIQRVYDGVSLNYNSSLREWTRELRESTEQIGYYTVSGWIKSKSPDVTSDVIHVANSGINANGISIELEPVGQWKYFSYMFCMSANALFVRTDMREQVTMRDVRITFQQTGVIKSDDVTHTNMTENVLYSGNTAISFNDVRFYYVVNGDLTEAQNVTLSDVIRYKMRKKREGVISEGYYNNLKGVINGTTELKVLYGGSYIGISELSVGMRIYAEGKKSEIRININETNSLADINVKHTVEGSDETIEKLDRNFDIIEISENGVTTAYTRNTRGQVTSELVEGFYLREVTYTDELITVTEKAPTATGSAYAVKNTKKYYIDGVWGTVEKTEVTDSNGVICSVIRDEYDESESVIKQKGFDNALNRKNNFVYSKGNLIAVSNGVLGYGLDYSEKGEIARIRKNNSPIEQHTYTESDGETTIESKYPSAESALFSETKTIDKYGRLKSESGIIENAYDVAPGMYYIDNKQAVHFTMEGYNRAEHGDLIRGLSEIDGKDGLLSQTTDHITGETMKYGYYNDKLTAAVAYDGDGLAIRQETFIYDSANRLTKTRFDYDLSGGEYALSEIEYEKAATDPLQDSRVKIYRNKIGGAEKAKTENTYDVYKRITNKKYTIGGRVFTQGITYDKTKISAITQSSGGTTAYRYDDFERIAEINNGTPITYEYDEYGQIIRENNKVLNKTFVYGYDSIGNICVRQERVFLKTKFLQK